MGLLADVDQELEDAADGSMGAFCHTASLAEGTVSR
jgi:hypothetical protein